MKTKLFFFFFLKKRLFCKTNSDCEATFWEEVASPSWWRLNKQANKQTNRGARQSAITDLCSKKPSNLFPLYLIRKSRGIFNVHSVNGKQLTGAN